MIILIDTREQRKWTFSGYQTEPATLASGDYSVKGLSEYVAVERKSLADLVGCITSGRDRFKRELLRLKSYRCKSVIIEANFSDIASGCYRSKVKPQSVIGSLASWQNRYQIPFVFAGNEKDAARYCLALFKTFLSQCQEFMKSVSLNAD